MMGTESYRLWNPTSNTPKNLSIEAVYSDSRGFRIILGDPAESKDLLVTFIDPIAYRSIDESNRLRTWGSPGWSNPGGHSFFIVESSLWVAWLIKESPPLKGRDLTHYAFYTGGDCVDVIDDSQPDVTWIPKVSSATPDVH